MPTWQSPVGAVLSPGAALSAGAVLSDVAVVSAGASEPAVVSAGAAEPAVLSAGARVSLDELSSSLPHAAAAKPSAAIVPSASTFLLLIMVSPSRMF